MRQSAHSLVQRDVAANLHAMHADHDQCSLMQNILGTLIRCRHIDISMAGHSRSAGAVGVVGVAGMVGVVFAAGNTHTMQSLRVPVRDCEIQMHRRGSVTALRALAAIASMHDYHKRLNSRVDG